MVKNLTKGVSYQAAWSRIKSAMEGGFYFEAVTICESVIADRLLSYIRGADQNCKATTRTPLADLIKTWDRITRETPPKFQTSGLISRVDNWRKARNEVAHSFVKSEPGTPTVSVPAFMAKAKSTAAEGIELARAVLDWHRKELRHHLRQKKSNS